MTLNILDHQTVQTIIQNIESDENRQRKKKEWIAYQCTQGMVRDYVMARLALLYPKNYKKMRVSDISVSKKVVDKLANAYCETPLRAISTDSEEAKKEFNEIYADGHFNSIYQEFDEIFNLHRQGLFWCDYNYEDEEFRPMVLRPFEYDLIRDQKTGKVLCVALNYPDLEITTQATVGGIGTVGSSVSDYQNQLITESQYDSGSESKVYALWTDTQHAVVVISKKELNTSGGTKDVQYAITFADIDGNADNVNPLGELPFVYKQKGSSIDYPTFNPLTEHTIGYNVMKTDLLTSATMQGFGQAVLKYPDDAEIREIEVGYMNAVRLPQSSLPGAPPTDFKFENANPDLAGQRETYLSYLKEVLGEYGITSSEVISGDSEKFRSGIDRLLSQADVQKVIKKNQEVYSDMENEVFELIQKWTALLGDNTLQNVEEFSVFYPKPQVMTTDTEVINNIKTLLDLGLTTKKKAMMRLNPNLNEQQAERELQDIINEKKDLLGAMSFGNGPAPIPPIPPPFTGGPAPIPPIPPPFTGGKKADPNGIPTSEPVQTYPTYNN